jgi:hypothetical protein
MRFENNAYMVAVATKVTDVELLIVDAILFNQDFNFILHRTVLVRGAINYIIKKETR